MFARDEFGQVFPFLLWGSVEIDLIDAEIRMRPIGEADAGRCAGNLFDHHRMGQIAQPHAAKFFIDGYPENPNISQLLPQLRRKLIVAIHISSQGFNLVLCKTMHQCLKGVDILAKIETHAGCKHRTSTY